jgi:hypothetical protein
VAVEAKLTGTTAAREAQEAKGFLLPLQLAATSAAERSLL